MGVVGRAGETAEIDQALADAASAGASTVVLEGEAGIGKTTLLEYGVRRAAGMGWTVLLARMSRAEAQLTYVGLGDLLTQTATEPVRQLPVPLRRALEAALLWAVPGEPPTPRAVAVGFLTVLERLAEEAPVLVAVDDAHWLDRQTSAVLDFATRRLDGQRVVALLALRSGESEPFPIERVPHRVVRIRVGPMRPDALHALIRAQTGSRLRRRQLSSIAGLSGGNPLFALELARAASAIGSDNTTPPLPATLGDAVLEQIRALPPSTRHELLVAEVAAHPHLRLVKASPTRVAEQATIIAIDPEGAITFKHPLFAWAVAATASSKERKAAHLRVAERTVYPEERVRQLALAADGPNPELADDLEELAAVVRKRGAPGSSAELLSLSRRLTPPELHDLWASRAAREIALLYEAGDWEEAWALGEEALERLPPGPERAAVLIEAVSHRPGTAERCRQALIEANGDTALTIRGRLGLAGQYLFAFDIPASLEQVETAVGLARNLGDPHLLAVALTHLGIFRFLGGVDDPRPPLDQAIRIERELGSSSMPIAMSARCYIALVHACTDELDVARTMLEGLLVQAIETGDETSQAQVQSFLGLVETRAGNWQRARELLDNSINLADVMEFDQGRAEKRALLAALDVEQGRFDAARAELTDARTICTAIGDKFTLLLCLSILARIEMDSGHPEAALEQTEQIREILPDASAPLPLDFERTEIEALIAGGNSHEAARRLEALRTRSGTHSSLRNRIELAHGTSLLRASNGDLAGAAAALDELEADDDLRRAPYERARTLLLKGQLERRSKHKKAAHDALEQAATIYEQLGAPARADRCRAEAARIGLRRTTEALTESERRVAELAAAGKTNREIAAELFISRRTVEANIARIYKKLDIHTRAALAARADTLR
jgi:DNA-binding NarL/FixJ family response regulator